MTGNPPVPSDLAAIDDRPAATGAVVAFGPFRLHTDPLRLCRDGEEVRLGGRALDLLTALVARPGEVVSRGELEAQIRSAERLEFASSTMSSLPTL